MPIPIKQDAQQRVLQALAYMIERGYGISKAAALNGTTPQTIKKYMAYSGMKYKIKNRKVVIERTMEQKVNQFLLNMSSGMSASRASREARTTVRTMSKQKIDEADIIIKEGINISPKYLEEELLKIEYNDEVAVVGVKNNLYGEIPIAFIKSKKNKSKRNIIDILKKNISAKILPQDIIFLDKLPKNKIGKIDKNKLIKLYDNRARSFKS